MIRNNSKFRRNIVLSEVLVAIITVLTAVNFNCTAVTARHICYNVSDSHRHSWK